MAVRIGQSYVSEAAANFAKNSADEGDDILKNLQKKFPNLKITVGTAPFSGSGTNNLSISPKILQEMQKNPDKKVEYEALIYDVASQNISSPNLKSHGFIIDDKGGLRGWGISQHDDKKTSPLNKKDKKSWLQKLLPEQKQISPATKVELSAEKKFASTNELTKHLQKNYSVVKNGAASISKTYLKKCLNDEDAQQKLFDNLKAADDALKSHEGEIGFQGLRVKIDSEGNMKMESSKTTVTFNESKRARQLAAAQSVEDVQAVLNLLDTDLQECEEGLRNNFCDEDEVKKVKAMIERAKQRLSEVEKNPEPKNFSTVDILI